MVRDNLSAYEAALVERPDMPLDQVEPRLILARCACALQQSREVAEAVHDAVVTALALIDAGRVGAAREVLAAIVELAEGPHARH